MSETRPSGCHPCACHEQGDAVGAKAQRGLDGAVRAGTGRAVRIGAEELKRQFRPGIRNDDEERDAVLGVDEQLLSIELASPTPIR
jgi:hypothetical protein